MAEDKVDILEAQGDAQVDKDWSRAEAAAKSGKRKRRKPAGGVSEDTAGDDIPERMAQEAGRLFEPEQWEPIVEGPFALGQALTGRSCWQLEAGQRKRLAVTAAMSAEYWVQVDPKYIALMLFAMNFGTVLGQKFLENNRQAHAEAKAKQELDTLKGGDGGA